MGLHANATQVVTTRQDGTQPRWLGTLGHVTSLKYSFKIPGGCDQLSCSLIVPQRYRTDALNPGRVVQGIRGGSVVWDGELLEPAPSADGWQITAQGSGNYGDNYMANWSGTWGAGAVDQALGFAIGSRGLRWVNPGVSSTPGLWVGQQVDPASVTITDLLNLAVTKGGLTWYVSCRPRGNVLSMFPLPTPTARPSRLLICTDPEARTLGGDVNKVWVRYQSTWDVGGKAAQFAVTSVNDTASQAAHGNLEEYADISSAGVYSVPQAQGVAQAVLNRYQRASFADAFTVTDGQLQTAGGQPVDLGAEQAGSVCRLMLTDFGYGGEVTPAPVVFLVGAYEYDDDTLSATVTPFQSLRQDFASLLSAAVLTVPVRTQPVAKKKKGK